MMVGKSQKLSRDIRIKQIHDVFLQHEQCRLTRYDIAKLVGMTPSKHFYSIVEDAVSNSEFIRIEEVKHRSNSTKLVYSYSRNGWLF